MKKCHKIQIGSCAGLALCAGSVSAYLQARPQTPPLSDLTLANIEALAGANPEQHPLMCLGSEWMCASSSEADTWVPGYNVYNGGIPDIW